MGSVFGSKKAKAAKPYVPAQFQPYSYTSQVGTTTGTPSGNAFNVGSTIDPQLASIGQSALGSTQPFLNQYFQQAGQEVRAEQVHQRYGVGKSGLRHRLGPEYRCGTEARGHHKDKDTA